MSLLPQRIKDLETLIASHNKDPEAEIKVEKVLSIILLNQLEIMRVLNSIDYRILHSKL